MNVSPPVVRLMRRHAFADPAMLIDELLGNRMRLTRQSGARFASACFVTGALDPFDDRAALWLPDNVQTEIGYQVKPDMPGLQGPEVDALYARGRHWLAGNAL